MNAAVEAVDLAAASLQAAIDSACAGIAPTWVLERAVKARATDWAQVRPEWGLAASAAFIVAPRSRTRHLNLTGRSFVHDYRWQGDPGFAALQLVMTAPMLVTNWIKQPYHASTVDNKRYSSGEAVSPSED